MSDSRSPGRSSQTADQDLPWEKQGEIFTVETPELTSIEFEVADFGTRVAAAILDRALLALIVLGAALVGWLALGVLTPESGYFVAFLMLLWFAVSMLYFVYFEVRNDGRTPGKRAQKIRSIHLSGRSFGWETSVIRNLARAVDEIPLFWLVPLLSPGRRRLGDLLASTIVVRDRDRVREPAPGPLVRAAAAGSPPEFTFSIPSTALERLDPEDTNLLEYLDERLRDLSKWERRRLLSQVAQRYVDRLGLEQLGAQVQEEPLRFLQELLLHCRSRFDSEGRA